MTEQEFDINKNYTLKDLIKIDKQGKDGHLFVRKYIEQHLNVGRVWSNDTGYNAIEIMADSSILLSLDEDQPIFDVINNPELLKVDVSYKEYYNPNLAGVFREYLNKKFGFKGE